MSETRRRLSAFRVLIAVLVPVVLGAGGWFGYQQWHAVSAVQATAAPWFAPYVDVTATPEYGFEDVTAKSARAFVLGFVVAASSSRCTPSWGTYDTLSTAATNLDLDRRIARLRQQGGDIAVSFGGQANTELALACSDESKLQAAYSAVLGRYRATTMDLDLEGSALTDSDSILRRALAVAAIQKERRAAGKPLAVWLTLPVDPNGLTADGQTVVADMLSAGVDLAGVNAMTMDYGSSLTSGQTMLSASESALTNVERQLGILYRTHGTALTAKTIWHKIGATPMIGQNDSPGQIFTLKDARALNAFARDRGLGRLSMWSANRDQSCSANYVDVTVVSDECSGIAQGSTSFAAALMRGYTNHLASSAQATTTPEPTATAVPSDDPARSPYQIWSAAGTYVEGTKVVWHHNVYEAKWWTQGDVPDSPVLNSWQTPWKLIGPVLPGETPVPQPTVPAGTLPAWNPGATYQAGTKVELDGVGYEAKWWTRGDSPDKQATDPDDSPWAPLTTQQIQSLTASRK